MPDQTSLPRHDERTPLDYDARKQAFVANRYQRSLEDLKDPMLREFDPRDTKVFETVRPVHCAIENIKELILLHEMTWRQSRKNSWLLYFPFMFVTPERGWKLRNRSTKDVYTVKKVVKDGKGDFTGGVLLSGGLQPPGRGTTEDPDKWDRLEWVDEGRTILFHESWPEKETLEREAASDSADEGASTVLSMGPTITVHVSREEPGSTDKREFGPAKMSRPRLIRYIEDPFDPVSYRLGVHVQLFETILQFDCWSPLNKEADRLVDWFKTFMNFYTWVIKLHGVQELRFWQRRADLTTQRFRDALPRRSLQYYLRTNEITAVRSRNVTTVNIAARVHEGHSPIHPDQEGITGGGLWADQWDRFHDESGNWLGGTIDIEDTRDHFENFVNP